MARPWQVTEPSIVPSEWILTLPLGVRVVRDRTDSLALPKPALDCTDSVGTTRAVLDFFLSRCGVPHGGEPLGGAQLLSASVPITTDEVTDAGGSASAAAAETAVTGGVAPGACAPSAIASTRKASAPRSAARSSEEAGAADSAASDTRRSSQATADVSSVTRTSDAAPVDRGSPHSRQLPGNDALFADSLRKVPVVLGLAGSDEHVDDGSGFAPMRLLGPMPALKQFRGATRSLPEIDIAATGRGLFNADENQGVVRQVPLVAKVAGHAVLSLPMECIRIAVGEPVFGLDARQRGQLQLLLGDVRVPVHTDGSLWLYYAGHEPTRFVSAADVLDGRVDADARRADAG